MLRRNTQTRFKLINIDHVDIDGTIAEPDIFTLFQNDVDARHVALLLLRIGLR